MKKKLTRFDLQKMKEDGRRAVWVTAYDFITAQLAEEAGMDMLLVGDSRSCLWHRGRRLRWAGNDLL